MTTVTRIALVDPNDATRAIYKNLLLGLDTVWLEAECSKYEFFMDVVLQSQPALALISLDSNPQKALELIARVHQELPACNVLAVSGSQEGSLILQTIRAGAKEFLNAPLRLEDFLAALERIQHQSGAKSGDGTVRTSQIISLAGASGGIGCTSVAVNIACCLAADPANSVVLIDLDLALGDSDVWLDIIPDYTIQDVADNINRLDYALLKRSLTKHDSGVFLLPRPVEMEENPPLNPDELRRVLALLKATFTHLVIDISKAYTPLDLAALETSDKILLITQLDLPCLRNSVRLLQSINRKEGLKERVEIVINRVGLDDAQISLTKAVETLGRPVFAQIPNDYGTMVDARNNGVPLIMQAPRAKLTRSFQQLALQISPSSATGEGTDDKKSGQRKSLFSFLSSGSK